MSSEVRAKKALGQHFLVDQDVAKNIVGALRGRKVLEVGPGMGVLTQYLLKRPDTELKAVEIDDESVIYLRKHFPQLTAAQNVAATSESAAAPASAASPDSNPTPAGAAALESAADPASVASPSRATAPAAPASVASPSRATAPGSSASAASLIEGDFLKMDLGSIFGGTYSVIGNFPYNISSQIFFHILEHRDQITEIVCMVQKEVAQRIAEKPGTKVYGILSVFLQAWYDIEYLFGVGPGCFNPPPKVQSAVIRLTRNSRTSLGCDEKLFRTVVKTAFGQRRKTLRNSLKSLAVSKFVRNVDVAAKASDGQEAASDAARFLSDPIFDLRPERLSVEDFIILTNKFSAKAE